MFDISEYVDEHFAINDPVLDDDAVEIEELDEIEIIERRIAFLFNTELP